MRDVNESPPGRCSLRWTCDLRRRSSLLRLGLLALMLVLVTSGCALTKNNRMRRKGVETAATIETVSETRAWMDDDPVLEIGLRIEDEHGRGVYAQARQAVPLQQTAALRPGKVVTVRYDPKRPGQAVIVRLGRAPDDATAMRQIQKANALHLRLNRPGVGRPAQGVVMGIEELGVTINEVAHLVELHVLVIPEATPEGARPLDDPGTPDSVDTPDTVSALDPGAPGNPQDVLDPSVDTSPLAESADASAGFGDPRPSYARDPVDTSRLGAAEGAYSATPRAPYEAGLVAVVSAGRLDRYAPGRRLALVYDPADPSSVHIDGSMTPGCVSEGVAEIRCEGAGAGDGAGAGSDLGEALTSDQGLSVADAEREEKKAQVVRGVGFGVTSLGVAGVIAGVALQSVSGATQRRRDELDPADPDMTAQYDRLDAQATNQRRAAIATLASGSVLLVSGLLVLAFGKARLVRARQAQGKLGMSLTPAGVGLRF